MRTLRHHKLRLAFTLFLAMVFAMAGVPAHAFACGDMGVPVAPGPNVASAAAEACPGMTPDHCCCAGDASSQPGHAGGCELTRPSCDCTVQAPPAPPSAQLKADRQVQWTDAALLPAASASLQLPASVRGALAPRTTGPVRSACRIGTPSRAPPVL